MDTYQADLEQADFDMNENLDSWELTSEKCPNEDCGGTLSTAYFADGADDYTQKWMCDSCHELFEE